MKAVVALSKYGPAQVIQHRRAPAIRPGYVLLRTHAVAINPADHLYFTHGMAAPLALLGCDYAGTILEVGRDCKRAWKVGDRVCGCARSADPTQLENGTFAEVICVKADMGLKIPEGMSFEEACTLGLAVVTTGRCLYQKLDIPVPSLTRQDNTNKGWIFISGGSSAMGTMVIQYAKLSNFNIIATCSPRNFDLVRSYGAAHVFDYKNDCSIDGIKELVQGELKLCVDCISTQGSAEYCASVLAPEAVYSSIGLARSPRSDITTHQTMGYSFLGEEWEQMGQSHPPCQDDFEFSMEFSKLGEDLVAQGKIRTHPLDLRSGGLDAISKGMEDLKAEKISARKIVVSVTQS